MSKEFLANEVYASGVLSTRELLNVFRCKALNDFRLTEFKNEKRANRLNFTFKFFDEERKLEFDLEAKEITTGINCVSNSGTWEGWPATAMLTEDASYWCTTTLENRTEVWCIFEVGSYNICQMVVKLNASYPCASVTVFTGTTNSRSAEWRKIGEKLQMPFDGVEKQIVFTDNNDTHILLSFQNWQGNVVGVERVKFYGT